MTHSSLQYSYTVCHRESA